MDVTENLDKSCLSGVVKEMHDRINSLVIKAVESPRIVQASHDLQVIHCTTQRCP